MIGFIGNSLQLHPIMIAHNQLLSTTRSIPCWITSVFSSIVTNNEWRILAHTSNCLDRRPSGESLQFTNPLSFITSTRPWWKLPPPRYPLLCFMNALSRKQYINSPSNSLVSVATKHLVFSDLLPGSYSFAVICCNWNVISDLLLSNGRLLWLHHSGF
jgi:hypothetical protein